MMAGVPEPYHPIYDLGRPETVCARQSGQRCNCAEPCPVAPKKRSIRQKIRQGARKFELNRRGR